MANIGIDVSSPGDWTIVTSTASNTTNYPPPPKFHVEDFKISNAAYYYPLPSLGISQYQYEFPDKLAERQVNRYRKMLPAERPPELQAQLDAACSQYGPSNVIILPVIRGFVAKEKAEWDKDLPALTEQG